MPFNVSAGRLDAGALDVPLLVVLLAQDEAPPSALTRVDEAAGGALGRALAERHFTGRRDETLHLTGGTSGPRRILLVGLGKPTDRSLALRRAGALAARQARRLGVPSLAAYAPNADARALELLVTGLHMGAWSYEELKSPPPEDERKPELASAVVLGDEAAPDAAVAAGNAVGAGLSLARRLGMMPGNFCTPELLTETARDIAQRHGMTVSVLGRAELGARGMGAFLCVAQGTSQEPRLVTLEYRRGQGKPVVLVGKGLCFDTGGISIKPAQSMEWMKFDMSGAGGVLGAMEAIARLGLAINVVGIIGATTNMPSGEAVKPGDVVRSAGGKTIEVINTDAEGRLVLADLLAHAKTIDPAVVIDAATLTGACVIALGHTATGVFGPDEAVVREVEAAGRRAGEPGWALPLWDEYRELITSDVADVKNTGGRPAGSITAAMFLKEFVDGYPWVHLDVAGTAYSENDLVALPKGPTGVPVGTFVEFVRGRAG
ncbi:MAG TPA: leucyl aminopeptidase [Gemmatimonadaceae bacterium]|nr:leucyl aminopeptidase [Gemmatimonadaceae bacterium]